MTKPTNSDINTHYREADLHLDGFEMEAIARLLLVLFGGWDLFNTGKPT